MNHKVAAIIAGGGPAALAAASATTTIPIIFSSRANPIAVLVNSSNPNSPKETSEGREAQALLGIKTAILQASTGRDIDAAFAKAVELKVGALVIGADPYFDSHLDKFAALATRFAMPTIHALHEFVTSG